MRIYLASSWRNDYQPHVLSKLLGDGHEVYDFRHPPGGLKDGFQWTEVDEAWMDWTPQRYVERLSHPIAERGFRSDMDGLVWSNACVYLMPCGVSASLEAGWAKGTGRPTVCYVPAMREPDLMVKMFDLVTTDLDEVRGFLLALEGRS